MRWLVTLLLAALVAAGAAFLIAGDRVRALVVPPPPVVAGQTVALLGELTAAPELTAVTVAVPGQPPLALTRAADGAWTQPGDWPLRDAEVATLVNTLAGLKTRFAPVGLADSKLAEFGLSSGDNPVGVTVSARTGEGLTREVKLTVGRASAASGFDRPSFIRVGTEPEVVRVGPDVYPVFSRPAETYRRRQLVPDIARLKLASDPGAAGRSGVPGDTVERIAFEVRTPRVLVAEGTSPPAAVPIAQPNVSLVRVGPNPAPKRDPDRPTAEPAVSAEQLAAAWAVEGTGPRPFRDRPDPAKLRAALAAVPDLWVESFVAADRSDPAVTGLDKPDRVVTVNRAGRRPLVVEIGNVARKIEREGDAPPRGLPGQPPPPPEKIVEEYRYAKLADNPQVFEIRADKFAAAFADAASYRDLRAVRIEPAEVVAVTLTPRGKPPVKLTKLRGDRDAANEDDRADRWQVDGRPADPAKASELVDKLAGLKAADAQALTDAPTPEQLKTLGLDSPAVVVEVRSEPRAIPGEPAPTGGGATIMLTLGTANDKKQLPVRAGADGRVTAVDAAVLGLAERPAFAYRGRRLFDAPGLTVTAVDVAPKDGPRFALIAAPRKAPLTGTDWNLTVPAALGAAADKAGALADALAKAEVAEYVDDAPAADKLAGEYGLAVPRFTVRLTLTGLGDKVLQVGAARAGKPEVFARLADAPGVFALPQTVVEPLAAGPLALLSPEVWAVPGRVTAVEVRRGAEAYTLAKSPTGWAVRGPFDAPVPAGTADKLVGLLDTVRAVRVESLAAGDPAKYGLAAPRLTLTLSLTDGTPAGPVKLLVGNDAPGGVFARAEGPGLTPAVFVVPAELVALADKPAFDRVDRVLLALDPAKVDAIAVTAADPAGSVTLTRADGKWTAAAPGFPVDAPAADALAAAASKPAVVGLAGYGSTVDWAKFGLDKPAATVAVTLATTPPEAPRVHTLKLGGSAPGGGRYLRVDDGSAVGVLTAPAAAPFLRGRTDYVDKTLLTFDPAALTAVKRTRGKDVLELAKTGDAWEVTKPTKRKADRPAVEELADQLGQLRAERVAAYDPKDLAPFGLKEPAAVLTLSAGGDKVLRLGAPADAKQPDGDRFAAVDAGSGKPVTVGVLPGALVKRLLADALQFRDRSLGTFAEADSVTVTRGARKATFTKAGGAWKMTAPVAAAAESADLDELVKALSALRADGFAADKPKDLAPFGLKTPDVTLALTAAGKPVLTLLVGTKEKDTGRVHAKLDKGDLVALLDPALTAKVLGEYRERKVWADLDPAQVETVTVSGADGNVVLRKFNDQWVDQGKPDAQVDPARVTAYLAALANLRADRYAADVKPDVALYGLATPARVIVVSQRGGVTRTLRLGGPEGTSGGKQVYAQTGDADRPAVFVLSAADTAALNRRP